MTSPTLRPAVFVDRDGTIIVEKSYLADPADVRLVPGAIEALAALRDAGYALVIVTNQSGIARGLYSLADYEAVAARLEQVLEARGVRMDAIKYCAHHPDFTGPCACRKPATGMYLEAAEELDLDPARSYYVGDKSTDVLPAAALGGQGILVRTGYGDEQRALVSEEVLVADDLAGAAELILGR